MAELISLRDAAKRLGVHVSTLRSWVRTGHVPAYRIGQRFTRVDWDELLARVAVASDERVQLPRAADSRTGAPDVQRGAS
ncbi:MAG TPA: helix-turn-helix domain-containing protein [Planctomycetota bacterium]|nr:helix-turn-helix domain-containing protein [Planctomycetota bacterium]